jgi:hypothetical protein
MKQTTTKHNALIHTLQSLYILYKYTIYILNNKRNEPLTLFLVIHFQMSISF